MKQFPTFTYEIPLWKSDYFVAGIDEVGRGSFAGPLYVGGVMYPKNMQNDLLEQVRNERINDSKLLSEKRRDILADFIRKTALFYTVTSISVEDINKVGIGKAGKIGFEHVARKLQSTLASDMPEGKLHILTDAFEIDQNEFPDQTPLIRGDQISITIASASIIAKVARDAYMSKLAEGYPEYLWNKNKGYGTLAHRKALQSHGPTPHHRIEFIRTTMHMNKAIE